MFPLFIFFIWILIAFAPLLEKKAKKQPGGVSLFPVIPLFPLLAWYLAWGLNLIQDKLGFYLVGGLHIILLIALSVSGIKWLLEIRRDERRAKMEKD